MTALDDVYEDIKNYPSTYVTIEIYDVDWDGVALNDEEDVEIRFRASNRGMLTMTDVTFTVEGSTARSSRGGTAPRRSTRAR